MRIKKRYIVFSALALGFLVLALIFGAARRNVTDGDMRNFAAETFRGESEERYVQLAAYLTDEDYLTPDGMMRIKNELEAAMTEQSITNGKYLLCGSAEKNVYVSRDTFGFDAVATVYFGDWFGLHPSLPIAGGFLEESAATTDFCVIDDLTAWRIFGSTDVCGMELWINEKVYTVNAVVAADRSEYAEYYGEKPRVYILYSSAAVRNEHIPFTSCEAVLPSPLTDAAKDMFTEAMASYTEEIYVITDRFSPTELWENISTMTSLGVMEGKSYPYYENVARIMETKCALWLTLEGVSFILAAVFLTVLLVLIFRPLLQRAHARRIAKKTHAIH